MKKFIIPMLLTLSFNAFADLSLPSVLVPEELARGDFAEGTITQISQEEIASFLPWAQNAQNLLTRALTTARSLPLRDRLPLIERTVRNVVARSGDRQYQMFMRFALNRGLLLVTEMSQQMDMEDIGAQESALDILQRSINVALSFYESDLGFQQRSQDGSATTVLQYAKFGTEFFKALYPGVLNVLDATAQYRLLYKLVEIANWDISRDMHANNYADSIIETHELLELMPSSPMSDDRANLRNIRRLNSLKLLGLSLSGSESSNEESYTPIGSSDLREYMFDSYSSVVRRVKARAENGVVVFTDGVTRGSSDVQELVRSYNGVVINGHAFDSYSNVVREVKYITTQGILIFSDGVTRGKSHYQPLVTRSSSGIEAGDQVLDTYSGVIRRVKYITKNDIIIFTDGVARASNHYSKLL